MKKYLTFLSVMIISLSFSLLVFAATETTYEKVDATTVNVTEVITNVTKITLVEAQANLDNAIAEKTEYNATADAYIAVLQAVVDEITIEVAK